MTTELVFRRKVKWLSLLFYLSMGWLFVIAAKPLLASLAPGGLILLVVGGLPYSLGVIFYVRKNISYHHAANDRYDPPAIMPFYLLTAHPKRLI